MHDRDTLHRFLFDRYPIRGHLVHLDAAWRALIEHRRYPQAILRRVAFIVFAPVTGPNETPQGARVQYAQHF